ncbi:hypothetical protein JCM17846_18800 [Iodidimonas nitroreducens]|uniref:Peptidase M14 domain-containing protein n=1 Tax=Iodidimonas nitroreducens TaxID=1236968 RepID=A0A5A7N7Y0_9PROT|nr:hypothetical protein JCM17846_18800 [Iodidimonas nitroreducens]
MEASVPVMHRLASAQDQQTRDLLDKSIILMVAPMNPDGHARRIDHSLSYMSETIVRDPENAGHDLWARQRANHYGFDLNRQWLLLAQPEARAWMQKWHAWKPNISADYHEMGTTSTRPTTYFFHPGEAGRTNSLIPKETRTLAKEIGQYHTRSFDEMKELYFTEELFDTYYIGTGSSYPQINGSIGMLFEVGTAKLIEVDTPLGRRSLANNIDMHVATAINSVRAAVAMRETLLNYQRQFALNSLDLAQSDRRGGSFSTLEMPKILLLFQDGIQRFDMGHLWDLLDRQMGLAVTLKQKDRLGEIDWDHYTHIILPGGRGVGLEDRLISRAAQWIREGEPSSASAMARNGPNRPFWAGPPSCLN